MLISKQFLNLETKLNLLYKESLSVPKQSNEYKILRETSDLLFLSLDNTLKKLIEKENANIHKLIKKSNIEILNILLDNIHLYKIKD